MPRTNRPIHEVVKHEELPGVLGRLGIHFEDDLREALQFPEALRDRGVSESDIRRLKEELDPRGCD
jgi:hypothetical protein